MGNLSGRCSKTSQLLPPELAQPDGLASAAACCEEEASSTAAACSEALSAREGSELGLLSAREAFLCERKLMLLSIGCCFGVVAMVAGLGGLHPEELVEDVDVE